MKAASDKPLISTPQASPRKSGGASLFNNAPILHRGIEEGIVSIERIKQNKEQFNSYTSFLNMHGGKDKNSPQTPITIDEQEVLRKVAKNAIRFFTVSRDAKAIIKENAPERLHSHYYYILHTIFIYPFINKHKKGGVPIHQQTARNILGRNTARVLQNLQAWGIISSDRHSIHGKKSFHYKINPDYMKNLKNEPCSNADIRDRLLARRELLLHKSKDSHPIIEEHIGKIRVKKEAAFSKIARMTTNSKGEPFTDKDRAGFRNLVLNIENEIIYCKQDRFSGRIHTNLTVLPRWLRKYITVEGESLVQVDMPTAQPMLLHRAMRKAGYMNKELRNYKKVVETGQFYEYFDDLFPEMPRHKKKIWLLVQLFFDKPRKHTYASQKRFKDDFPTLAGFVEDTRETNYKNMPQLLQAEEVDFIRSVVLEFKERYPDTFISTIHDSIVVKDSDGEKALEVMQWMYSKELYKVNLSIKSFDE